MKCVSFLVLLLAGVVGAGEASATFTSAPLLRMYRTISGTFNDNFYTTLVSDRDYSITHAGYTLPTSGPDFIGFVGQQFFVSNSEARPFQRFYMGAPQTDHFYTSSASEMQFVVGFGYTPERVEGWIFTSPVHGSTQLYRLSYLYSNGGDLKHFYSTDTAEINSRLAAGGWVLDTGRPGVPNEYIWPVPQPVDRATVEVHYSCGTLTCGPAWVSAPAITEYNLLNRFDYCGGIAELFIDGNHYRTIGHGDWRLSRLPDPVFSPLGCNFSLLGLSHGTHQVRIEYSGYSGYFLPSGIYWYIPPSFSRTYPYIF